MRSAALRRGVRFMPLPLPILALRWRIGGIAMSYGPNIILPPDSASDHAGYAAIQRALALSGTANASERDYIAAAATRFSAAAKPNFDTLGR